MFKRAFDVLVSAVALIVLSPLLILLAGAVRLTSQGTALYRARRVGRNGQSFELFKFRSMVADADKHGPGITTRADARITPLGRVLRRSKLDELPQLLNVLRGEMSFVGPRPEDPRYVALYTPEQRRILSVRPGITSLASLEYRHEEELLVGDQWEQQYIHTIMPAKLAIDLRYADHASLLQDLSIITRTVLSLVFGRTPP